MTIQTTQPIAITVRTFKLVSRPKSFSRLNKIAHFSGWGARITGLRQAKHHKIVFYDGQEPASPDELSDLGLKFDGEIRVILKNEFNPLAGYYTRLGSGSYLECVALAKQARARLTEIGKEVEDCWTGTHYQDPVDPKVNKEINGWTIYLLQRYERRMRIFA